MTRRHRRALPGGGCTAPSSHTALKAPSSESVRLSASATMSNPPTSVLFVAFAASSPTMSAVLVTMAAVQPKLYSVRLMGLPQGVYSPTWTNPPAV